VAKGWRRSQVLRVRQMKQMIENAAMAPSTHNSQPWMFILGAIGQDEIRVWADRARWLPVADPDRREMHLSVGCALENLLVTAEHFGLHATVQYFPHPVQEDYVACVRLQEGGGVSQVRSALLDAIPARRTAYERYDGRLIPEDALARLRGTVVESDVRVMFFGEPAVRRTIEQLVVRADALQFADPAFRAELSSCIGRGAYGAPWLLAKLGQMAIAWLDLGESAGRRDSEVLMSSPQVAIVATTEDTSRARVHAGQAFERLHLMATVCGISLQPMNQVVQVAALRASLLPAVAPECAEVLHPQMVLRLGYCSAPSASPPRRPLEDLLL